MIQPPDSPLFTPEGDIAPEYWVDDLKNLRDFIDSAYSEFGLVSGVTFLDLHPVESTADRLLRTHLRMPTPSVFKRAAAFSIAFMQESPLACALGATNVGQKIGHILNHQNAIVAFGYARRCLHGATYKCQGVEVSLSNRIKVSVHFYSDLVLSLTTIPKKSLGEIDPSTFHTLALLYESLAFDCNDRSCRDPLVV